MSGSRGEPDVTRDELQATLAARSELGPEMEPALVDAFVERIERRLAERAPARAPRGAPDWGAVVLAVSSLVFAIPLIAVAANMAGSLAVLAVCVLLFVLNALYHEHSR